MICEIPPFPREKKTIRSLDSLWVFWVNIVGVITLIIEVITHVLDYGVFPVPSLVIFSKHDNFLN